MTHLNKKKLIHIIGGGLNQIPLVKRAKAKGLRILLTDMYPNPPAREFADYFEQVDTTDRERTLEMSQKHGIDFVASDMTDVAVPTVAYIAEKLGLPGIGYETSLRFTNKYVMRRTLQEKAPHVIPESHFFENPKEAVDFCRQKANEKDYIIKPVNSQGSRGVFVLKAHQSDTWSSLIHSAFLESQKRGILLERYIQGFEYSVETFVKDGKIHNLTLTKKYHYDHNPCLDERNTFLGDVAEDLEKNLFAVNAQVIQALNLPFGMTHAEYKLENGQPYLIEIAARGAGGGISSHIIPYLTQFDTLDALLKVYMDEPLQIQVQDYKKRFAVLKFFNFKPGKVKNITQDQSIVDQALFFSLNLQAGQIVTLPKDSRDRPGYFIVNGAERGKVLNLEKAIESAIQIDYDS